MRYLTAIAAALAVIGLAACGSASPGTTAAGGSPSPVSCKAQYETWRHGPARAAVKRMMGDLQAMKTEAAAGT